MPSEDMVFAVLITAAMVPVIGAVIALFSGYLIIEVRRSTVIDGVTVLISLVSISLSLFTLHRLDGVHKVAEPQTWIESVDVYPSKPVSANEEFEAWKNKRLPSNASAAEKNAWSAEGLVKAIKADEEYVRTGHR